MELHGERAAERSAFEKENAPFAGPLLQPKTRKLALVTVAVFTGRSNVTDTAVVLDAVAFRAGTSAVTTSSAEAGPAVQSRTRPATRGARTGGGRSLPWT